MGVKALQEDFPSGFKFKEADTTKKSFEAFGSYLNPGTVRSYVELDEKRPLFRPRGNGLEKRCKLIRVVDKKTDSKGWISRRKSREPRNC